jgi:hypothetical protein
MYGLVVGLAGPVQYALEKSSSTQADTSMWTSFFAVSYTQATIGYGVGCPTTLLAQIAIIFSIFSGIFLQGLVTVEIMNRAKLRLPEFLMCAELMNNRYKRKHLDTVTRVIQSWWRLLKARTRKQSHIAIVSLFYRELFKFRKILVHCNRINTGLFSNQAACFQTKVQANLHQMSEYLYLVRHMNEQVTHTQTQDLVRSEYKIKCMAKKAKRLAVKLENIVCPMSAYSEELESPIRTHFTTVSPKSVRNRAKAQQIAVQNAKQRLIRQKSPDFLYD